MFPEKIAHYALRFPIRINRLNVDIFSQKSEVKFTLNSELRLLLAHEVVDENRDGI